MRLDCLQGRTDTRRKEAYQLVGALGDGAVTKSKLASDVLTVARADTYEQHIAWETNTNNTFLSAENGGGSNTAIGCGALRDNTEGYYTPQVVLVLYKTTPQGVATPQVVVVLYRANTTGHNNTASGFWSH